MRVSSKRLAGWVTVAVALISFSRVAVLFLESLSTVRAERAEDHALIELCGSDARAKASPKLRSACLQAQADRASPIILKAIVRAVSTTWSEFVASVNSPFGMATCVLFVLSSLVLPSAPIVKAVAMGYNGRSTVKSHLSDDEESDDERPHIIMVNGHGSGTLSRRKLLRQCSRDSEIA